jgi:aquaporin NIP
MTKRRVLNPVRSLGPALISGHFASLWLYLVAPILGPAIGVISFHCVRESGCCAVLDAPGS